MLMTKGAKRLVPTPPASNRVDLGWTSQEHHWDTRPTSRNSNDGRLEIGAKHLSAATAPETSRPYKNGTKH